MSGSKLFASKWVKSSRVDSEEVAIAYQKDQSLRFLIQYGKREYRIRAELKEEGRYDGTWSYVWRRKRIRGALSFTLYQSNQSLLLFGKWHEDGEHHWWIELPKVDGFGSGNGEIRLTPEGTSRAAKLVPPAKSQLERPKARFKSTGSFSGEFTVENNDFVLIADRFIVRESEIAFSFQGRDSESFSGEGVMMMSAEGGTHPTSFRYRYKETGEISLATLRIEQINETDSGCEVVGQWAEGGDEWKFRGELERIQQRPPT